jgi:hypothetical protein
MSTPAINTREYVCDLLEVCYMTLKLLDINAKACNTIFTEDGSSSDKHDTVAKMKAAATGMDVSSYFARKIVSINLVFMVTQLLSQYAIKAPHVNHRIIAIFL